MKWLVGKLAVIGLLAFQLAGPDRALAKENNEPLQAARFEGGDKFSASQSAGAAVDAGSSASKGRLIEAELGSAELFVAANSLYEQGNYEKAIELYEGGLARGAEGAYVHFNLGNAFLRNGELGKAIGSYLRSRRDLPREEDVRANLKFARNSTKDAIDPPDPSPLLATLFFWHYGLSRTEVLRLLVGMNFLFWAIWSARLFFGGSEVLRWAFMLFLALLIAVGGSAATSAFASGRVAVIIPQEVEAHTGPSADSVVRFKLHAGTELRIQDSQDGWLRVALPTGEQGWIDRGWADIVNHME
jgi:tetratricopeptide (TPR) repeat protein